MVTCMILYPVTGECMIKKLICSLSFIFWNYSSFFTTAMITFTETYILHSSLIIWKFLYILSIIMKLMLTKKYKYKLQSQTWRLLGHTLFNKPVKFTSVKTNERKTADKLGVFVVVTSVGPSLRVRVTEEIKSCLCKFLCKWLDFQAFSETDYKPYTQSHASCS